MNKNFQKRIDKLHDRLQEIKKCKEVKRTKLGAVPVRGVYLFLENGKPIYVGRTNRMRQRLLEHSRDCSRHNDATFAFKLAKDKVKNLGINFKLSRTDLVSDTKFDKIFLEERQRVARMSIKYIEINDPIDQYLFEVYASEVLHTPYNDFENH